MNIPKYALFELGFGYKYQYLISALLYTIIKKDINYESTLNYINKKLQNSDVHANPEFFIQQVKNILTDVHELTYNVNTLIMLEGEYSCFEDINLFTTNQDKSQIRFMQVKGSMSDSSQTILNNAVIKTIANILENQNIALPFQLTVLLNKGVSSYFFANSIQDKVKIIVSVIMTMKFMKEFQRENKNFYTDFLNLLDEYIENSYSLPSNQNLNIYIFFYQKKERKNQLYKRIIYNNSLFKIILSLKYIISNTRIIENMDYRLVYLFLKYQYGNDKLTKLLWNIEMQSMNGEAMGIKRIKNELFNINFTKNYIRKIKFSQKSYSINNKFKIGKVL